ncbi:uncharacterized protein PIG-Wa [Eurosta solidaginis]|uniref:uncharacterized protein PIG-Wa n=1 Tax=Eurosta solidaginis TaxID=178769 RepID=UPI0035306DEA
MGIIERTGYVFCDYVAPELQCHCTGKQQFLCLISYVTCTDCGPPIAQMNVYDKKQWETLENAGHTLWTITPIVFFYALARIICQIMEERFSLIKNELNFLIEFLFIVVPTVLFLSVWNEYFIYMMLASGICILIALYVVYDSYAYKRWYIMGGHRPFVLTLNRATINLLTVVCILAVDFKSFPKHFRKTHRYGVGLMDTGIGLFVFAMGAVSRPPKTISEFWSALRPAAALLVMGILRTTAITLASYEQDELEYGRHMNAFFTLGLTKLFGSIFSGIAQNPWRHIVVGVAVLGIHELALQLHVAKFVMNPYTPRNTLISANREGIFSIPGFVALYLLSYTIGQSLRMNDTFLSYHAFMTKLKRTGIACICLWLLVFGCIFSFSIARVTCNSGYVLWILAIALTMTFFFMIVFNLIVNSLWPVRGKAAPKADESQVHQHEGGLLHTKSQVGRENIVPAIVDAINMNGLLFFILANLLTGLVNMCLRPKERSDVESFVILTIYMLILNLFVHVLHRFQIKIA